MIQDLQRQGYAKIPSEVYSLNADKVAKLSLVPWPFSNWRIPDEIHWRLASAMRREIASSQQLGSLACHLMGWKSCRIGHDDVVHKPSPSYAVGFRQDCAYISDNFYPQENKSLTLWLALDDSDEKEIAI